MDGRLHPLRDKAVYIEKSVDNVRKDIESQQLEIKNKQDKLSNQLKITELSIDAKAGSRESYNSLLSMAKNETEHTNLLKASLKEIELFFDADRGQLLFPILVKKSTMKAPGYSVDEVVHILRTEPDLTEPAINVLSNLKSKASVKELCVFIEKTDNLRAAARATRALEEITGERFRPLEFEKVTNWWTENSANKIYSGSYDGYLSVVQDMWRGPIDPQRLERFVKQLTVTCESQILMPFTHTASRQDFFSFWARMKRPTQFSKKFKRKTISTDGYLFGKLLKRLRKGIWLKGCHC